MAGKDTTFLDRVSDIAFERLKKVGGDPTRLPEALQTVVVIYSVQSVIDNGGFQYLFESDFPGNPPYSFLSQAYRRIGATEAADCIDRAAALFPFPVPHLHVDRRNAFLKSLEESHEMFRLGGRVCGDENIWKKLEAYAQANRSGFPGCSI